MQINNQSILNKFFLNISNLSESNFNFSPGEILKGQVQEIKENGLVSIYLKGKTIDAFSTIEVSKGQQLFLMVEDIKEGKIVLKILTSEILNKKENSNLSNTLKAMNLPVDDKNLQQAKKLIQKSLPVTLENIKSMSRGVSLLNESSPRSLEIVGLAMTKGVPITLQSLESFVQFFDGKSNLASLTNETFNILDKITSNGINLNTSQTAAVANIQPNSANNAFQLLNQLIKTMNLHVDERATSNLSNEITQALTTNLSNENDLVRGFGLVKDILGQKEMSEIPKNLINLLINNLDQIQKELAGQKLTNVMSRFSSDSNLDFYYVSFPVKVEGEYRLSQLRISKNAEKGSIADMDNVKFAVSLDTGNLGLVLFHVEWHKSERLKIEGVVESEAALKYLESNVDKLISDLKSHNYAVDYNGIKVSKYGNAEMRLKLEEKNEAVKTFEIDVWV